MHQDHSLIQKQIESYTKILSNNSKVNSYKIFYYRKQLRNLFKDDLKAQDHLEKLINNTEKSLQNILNFYPHN